jgi:hypothetical protein
MKRLTKSDCDVFRMHRNVEELPRMFEAMPGDVVLSPKPKPKTSVEEL